MARHVNRFQGSDVLDLGDVGRAHNTEDLVHSRVHAGAVERRTALLAGLGQQARDGLARRVRVVRVAVPPGDPVGGGDDVDARLENLYVEVLIGEDTMKGQDVRFGGDDFLDGAGRLDTYRGQTDDLAGVATDLVR